MPFFDSRRPRHRHARKQQDAAQSPPRPASPRNFGRRTGRGIWPHDRSAYWHFAADTPDHQRKRQDQAQQESSDDQPPMRMGHHRGPVSREPGSSATTSSSLVHRTARMVITQANTEPAKNAVRYHNHWLTKSIEEISSARDDLDTTVLGAACRCVVIG